MHKVTVTRDFKSPHLQAKNDYLNPQQKRELKKMLIEKFTKLFGLANPGAVVDEVNRFFESNLPINSKTLADLETQVKRNAIKHKSNVSVKSLTQSAKSQNKEVCENICPNYAEEIEDGNNCMANGQANKLSRQNLSNADEEDEADWDTLGAYQAYILKQEKELEKKKRALEQKSIRVQLNKQVDEKKHRSQLQTAEHQSYVNVEALQLEQHKIQTELNEKRKADEKKHLFEMQQKMIQERDAQLAREKQANDEMDRKIKECIEHDLVKQKQLQMDQAEARRQEMIRVRQENELRKQKRKQLDDKERKEEIELQKLSDKLAQELENQRNAELKAKADKIQQMIVMGEKVVKHQKDKNLEEERRINEYIEKKNRAMDRKERRMHQKEKENKDNYKQFLEYQMNDKKERTKNEREFIREQADIWKQEEEFYSKVKEDQLAKQHTENMTYKQILERQMQEKNERAAKKRTIEMPDEDLMKQKLFEQIQALDLQHKLLDQQLHAN
jgi:hypothetical protein